MPVFLAYVQYLLQSIGKFSWVYQFTKLLIDAFNPLQQH